jgi:mannose-6-phosphate isomerase-like protein (cupin superfamily)
MTNASDSPFATLRLPVEPTAVAPDGSDVRVLLALSGGSMAHFTLAPDSTSLAVRHRTAEELWYMLSGRGQMWRRQGECGDVTELAPGTCLTIPTGVSFQFRNTGQEPLTMVAVTMPPWPGEHEAEFVSGNPNW